MAHPNRQEKTTRPISHLLWASYYFILKDLAQNHFGSNVSQVCVYSVLITYTTFLEWLFSILKRWFVAYFFFYKWNEGGKICKSMFQNKNKQYFFFRENLKETSLKKSHALCRKIYPAPYFWVGLNGCSCPFESLYF